MSDTEGDNFGKNIIICCIGVVIVALILTGVYMIFYDSADKSADVIIDGKKITLHNLTQNQINNKIDGNNSDCIAIYYNDDEYSDVIYHLKPDANQVNLFNTNVYPVLSYHDEFKYIILNYHDDEHIYPSDIVIRTNDGEYYEIWPYGCNWGDIAMQLNE